MAEYIEREALLKNRYNIYMGFCGSVPVVNVKDIENAPAADVVEVVRCRDCIHQRKAWHKDRRMKEGGYWVYSCDLNSDPFVSHAVDGKDDEFCSKGERRVDNG